jgi:beta-lactamase superfamily II metal-dependent hydrolase
LLRLWLVALSIGALVGGGLWLQRPPQELRLTQLALPAADGWLVEVPGSAPLLIDGGDDGTALAVQIAERLPVTERQLAALLLTRADHGLIGQLAVSARYQVVTALLPQSLPGAAGTALRETLQAAGSRSAVLQAGSRLALGGLTVTVLQAADGRDGGAVLLLVYGRRRIVLHSGGGAGDAALLAAAPAVAPIDVLYYPWQRPADHPLIAALQPQVIVYTSAYHDRQPVLQSYAERAAGGRRLYHPALDGTVTLYSDGSRLRLETEPP